MGLPIPSDRTLRNFMRLTLDEEASGRAQLGGVIESNIRTFTEYQCDLRQRAAARLSAANAPMVPTAPMETQQPQPLIEQPTDATVRKASEEVLEGILRTVAFTEGMPTPINAEETARRNDWLSQRYAVVQLTRLENRLRAADDGSELLVGHPVMLTNLVYPHESALNRQFGVIMRVGDHRRGYVVELGGERRVRVERCQVLSMISASDWPGSEELEQGEQGATRLEPSSPSSAPPPSAPPSPPSTLAGGTAPAMPTPAPPVAPDLATQVPSVAGALSTLQATLGFDETDFDKMISVDERSYMIYGAQDLSAIGGYDPKPLSQRLRSLASPLDSVMRGSADTTGAVQLALDELAADVPRRRTAVCAAKAEYAKRILLYDQRNHRVGATRTSAKKQRKARSKHPQSRTKANAEPEVTTIVQARAALADRSTPTADDDSVTHEVANRLKGRLVRRWWPGEDGEEPTVGVITKWEVDEDGVRYFTVEHPTVASEDYGDELTDLVDLDALLTGASLEGEDEEDQGRLKLVPFADMTSEQLIAKEITKDALKVEASQLRPKVKIAGGFASANKKQLADAIVSHYAAAKQRLQQLMAVAHAAANGDLNEDSVQAAVADIQQEEDTARTTDQAADGEAAPAAPEATAGGAASPRLEPIQAQAHDDADNSPSQRQMASVELKAKQVHEIAKRQDAIELAMQRLSLVLRLLRDAKAQGYSVDIDLADEAAVGAADAETSADTVAGPDGVANSSEDEDPLDSAREDAARGASEKQPTAPREGQRYPKVALKFRDPSKPVAPEPVPAPIAVAAAKNAPLPAAADAAAPAAAPSLPVERSSIATRVERSSIATRARTALIELFKERAVMADKLLVFMLSDISHTCSLCIARFAVTASMDSQTLNELVEYVLAEVRRVSGGMLDLAEMPFEVADGARTNLVRECRASVRTSARPSMPGDRGMLPCSTREVAIDTNAAVRLWRVRRDAIAFADCGAVQSEAAKRALKQAIYTTFCGVLLPMGVRHWPNLYGWLHQMFAKRKDGGAATGEGAMDGSAPAPQPEPTPVEVDDAEAARLEQLEKAINSSRRRYYTQLDQQLTQEADDVEMEADWADRLDEMSVMEVERSHQEALEAAISEDVQLPPVSEARPPFRHPRPAAGASSITNEEAQAQARERTKRMREKHRSQPGKAFKSPRKLNEDFKKWLTLEPLGIESVDGGDVQEVWEATSDGGFRMLHRKEYDEYDDEVAVADDHRAAPRPPPLHASVQASMGFAARVRQAQAQAAHLGESGSNAHWVAMRGASFSSRKLPPIERRLFERLRAMRPPNHDRPLARKMAAALKGTAAPDIDDLLEVSRIKPMPTQPTSFGGEGLAAALLWASGDEDGEGGEGGDGSESSAGGGGAKVESQTSRANMCTMAALQCERFMRLAVDQPEVTVMDMLYELRVALMDRIMWELATFYEIELRDQVVVRDGHWFIQCWVHKYKNLVQSWRALELDEGTLAGTDEEPGFSRARLVRVARKLEADAEDATNRKMYRAVALALLGKTDALSQAAMTWVLICPQFLEALDQDPTCWLEHTVLYVCGRAYMGWDMPHLTDAERSYRIELCEAVLMYSVGGEQMYLPFMDESTKGKQKGAEPGLVGILAGKIGGFTSQNLLAFLANGAARRQFREQYPKAWESFVEKSVNNNPCENFFSLIAQQLGYKPRMMEFEARARELDYAMHEEFDPARAALYSIHQSKRKWYDMANFCLQTAITAWNDGTGLDPGSKAYGEYIMDVAKRAVSAAKGKYEGVHAHHKKASTEARH